MQLAQSLFSRGGFGGGQCGQGTVVSSNAPGRGGGCRPGSGGRGGGWLLGLRLLLLLVEAIALSSGDQRPQLWHRRLDLGTSGICEADIGGISEALQA
ncbi:hypothetical protein [Verrucomicrobium spinosum]|uniref:hypothetical protein n=1 Tax=Verrucomicrobium spinosum TaxID=2736 RepID=UPI001C462D5B|nr:hypothetical protein [Verrucomicrobium spinosum]